MPTKPKTRLVKTQMADDDIYTCLHEIGDAIRKLLGICLLETPFAPMLENSFMKNTFFPVLVGKDDEFFADACKRNMFQAMYLDSTERLPDITGELEPLRREAEKILQRENYVSPEFCTKFIEIAYLCLGWSNPEALFQIAGAAVAGDYIIINANSDLDWLWERRLPARWFHRVVDKGTLFLDINNMVPDGKYLDALYLLHGAAIKKRHK